VEGEKIICTKRLIIRGVSGEWIKTGQKYCKKKRKRFGGMKEMA
jgi:hypothetical protein